MRRKSPLRRRKPMRATGKTKYRARPRDLEYMRWVKRQPCAVRSLWAQWPTVEGESWTCRGSVEADHAGRRGIGRKADDDTCIPLCQAHHRQRTDFSGVFRNWDQALMRGWLANLVDIYRLEYERRDQ